MNTSQFHFLSKSVRLVMAASATPLAARRRATLVRHGTSSRNCVVLHRSPGGRGAADGGVAVERRPLPKPVAAGRAQKGDVGGGGGAGGAVSLTCGRRGGVLLHVRVEHRPLRERGLALRAHVGPHSRVRELKGKIVGVRWQ